MSISDRQLLDTMQSIGGLLFRRLHDELNEADRLVLEEWMTHLEPGSRQFFEEITDWEQVQAALRAMYQIDEQAAFADIQKKIHVESVLATSTFEEHPSLVGRRYKRFKFLAAAIVLTLIVGIAVIFTLTNRKTEITSLPVAQRFKNDVAPGGDKAVLTLSDGSKIVLDSASNGELARQGATRVMKLENGQLSYSAHSLGAKSVSYNTVSTPRGGQYQVQLPDGSRVWLNAASSLRFPTAFTGKERRVELNGEAYFQVVKDGSMPFKVSVVSQTSGREGKEPMQVEVLGTELNIEAYTDEDEWKATLINGSVKVISGKHEAVLKPGQQVRMTSSLNVLFDANVEEATAWKNGLFQFQDASIESIMRQVGRWYDVDIVYKGKIDQQFIGKIPRQVQVSTLLKILESTGWVHFMIEGKKITVAP